MLEAIGQAFYSVTVGFGIMLTYAAYLPERVRLARAATIAAGASTSGHHTTRTFNQPIVGPGAFNLAGAFKPKTKLGFFFHSRETS